MSLNKMLNKRDPSTELWGAPDKGLNLSEVSPTNLSFIRNFIGFFKSKLLIFQFLAISFSTSGINWHLNDDQTVQLGWIGNQKILVDSFQMEYGSNWVSINRNNRKINENWLKNRFWRIKIRSIIWYHWFKLIWTVHSAFVSILNNHRTSNYFRVLSEWLHLNAIACISNAVFAKAPFHYSIIRTSPFKFHEISNTKTSLKLTHHVFYLLVPKLVSL